MIGNLLTKKTIYFLKYIYKLTSKLVYGFRLHRDTIYFYLKAPKILHLLVLFRYNSILRFDKLADMVVCDNLVNFLRFEITYIFWNIGYEYRFGLKVFTDGALPVYSLSNFYKSA